MREWIIKHIDPSILGAIVGLIVEIMIICLILSK